MRRVSATVALAVLSILTAAAPAAASHSENGGGGESPDAFAVGGGMTGAGSFSGPVAPPSSPPFVPLFDAEFGDTRNGFAAHSGPEGENPRGHFTVTGELLEVGAQEFGRFRLEGPVTCLRVVGNRAVFFYPFKNADPEVFGEKVNGNFIFVEDNGEPRRSSGDGAPDKIDFLGPLPSAVGGTCPTPVEPRFNLEEGNFTVHDPTTP